MLECNIEEKGMSEVYQGGSYIKKTIRESGMFRENAVNRNDPRGYYSRKYGNFPQNEFFPSDALNTL